MCELKSAYVYWFIEGEERKEKMDFEKDAGNREREKRVNFNYERKKNERVKVSWSLKRVVEKGRGWILSVIFTRYIQSAGPFNS